MTSWRSRRQTQSYDSLENDVVVRASYASQQVVCAARRSTVASSGRSCSPCTSATGEL